MVNKKGFMRMVEAVIAIIIILTALVLIASQRGEREEANLAELLPPILEEIAEDNILRGQILERSININNLENDIKTKLNNPSLDVKVEICDFDSANPITCNIESYPTNIAGSLYSKERVITSTAESGNKILKIFIWRKSS